jgi:hypothetical protein
VRADPRIQRTVNGCRWALNAYSEQSPRPFQREGALALLNADMLTQHEAACQTGR